MEQVRLAVSQIMQIIDYLPIQLVLIAAILIFSVLAITVVKFQEIVGKAENKKDRNETSAKSLKSKTKKRNTFFAFPIIL